MQVKALNRRAQQRYATFVTNLDLIAEQLDQIDKLIEKVDDNANQGWTVASQDELKSLRAKAFDDLDRLRTLGKKHEAELISRDWRF